MEPTTVGCKLCKCLLWQAIVVRCHFLCQYPPTAFTLTHGKKNIKEAKSISKEVSPYCYINAHQSLGGCEHWISSVSLTTDIKYLGCWERDNHIQYREKERSAFKALLSNIVWFYSPNVGFSCYFSCKNLLFLRHLFSGVKKETPTHLAMDRSRLRDWMEF